MQGQPVLSSIEDCHYYFHWDTSVICQPHECLFAAETCEIVQDELNMRYNFKQAPFTEDGKIKVSLFYFPVWSAAWSRNHFFVQIDYNQSKVEVNICGLHRKAVTDYSQDLVNLFFTHDLPGCGKEGESKLLSSIIRFANIQLVEE